MSEDFSKLSDGESAGASGQPRPEIPGKGSSHLAHALRHLAELPEVPLVEVLKDQFGVEVNGEPIDERKRCHSLGTELINLIWGRAGYSRGRNITDGPWDEETTNETAIKKKNDPKLKEKRDEDRAAWYRSFSSKYSSMWQGTRKRKRTKLPLEGKPESPNQTKNLTLHELILTWPYGPLSKIAKEELLKLLRAGDREAINELIRRLYPGAFRWLMATGKARSEHDAEDILSDSISEALKSLGTFRGDSKLFTWIYSIIKRNASDFYKREQPRYDAHSTDTQPYEENAGVDAFRSEGGGMPEELGQQSMGYRLQQGTLGEDGEDGAGTDRKNDLPVLWSRMRNPEEMILLGGHYEGVIDGYHWKIRIVGERRLQLMRYISKLKKEYREIIWHRYFKEMSFEEIGAELGITANAAEHRKRRAIKSLSALVKEDDYFEERQIPDDWTGRVLTHEEADWRTFERYAREFSCILRDIVKDLERDIEEMIDLDVEFEVLELLPTMP